MNKFRILLCLMCLGSTAFSQIQLTNRSSVSVLTISPGEALYSTFGHSAIRVKDDDIGLDLNFNYGTFNTATPGFYLKFLRGQLPYQISSVDFYLEMDYWSQTESRGVSEQVLNLTLGQKQAIFDFLAKNMQPENREYPYKFFYDNCSTRLRDVLTKTLGDSLIFDKKLNGDKSYRKWISKYASDNYKPWADFGMSLAIGLPADQKTGWDGAMFIPDNLALALKAAKLVQNGKTIPLVANEYVLIKTPRKDGTHGITPMMVFGALLIGVCAVTMYQWKSKKSFPLFDKVFFPLLGLAGWLLFFLWFGTNHGVTTQNMNLLWAFPLLIPFVYLKSNRWFWLLYSILLLVLLIIFPFSPQFIPYAIIPLVMAILIRLGFKLRFEK